MGKLIYVSLEKDHVDDAYVATSSMSCLAELVQQVIGENDRLFYRLYGFDWISFDRVKEPGMEMVIQSINDYVHQLYLDELEFDPCLMLGIFIWQTNVIPRMTRFGMLSEEKQAPESFFFDFKTHLQTNPAFADPEEENAGQLVLSSFLDRKFTLSQQETTQLDQISVYLEAINARMLRSRKVLLNPNLLLAWKFLYRQCRQ